jgi:hypothetical protein
MQTADQATHAVRQVASILALAALGLSTVPAVGAPASPSAKLSQSLRDPSAWTLDLAGGAQATLVQAKDKSLVVTISTADSTDYHVRLAQAPVTLAEGKIYTVRFRAKADQPRVIKLYAQTDQGDFHPVGLDTAVQLKSQWSDYTFSFTATKTEPKHVSCPQFLLGSQTGTVWLADVSLLLAPLGTVIPGTVSTSPPTGLVWQFRNFDPGVGSLRQEGTAQVVTTISTDGVGWHVQLNRLNSILPEGQPVTVRFRARASAPVDMVVSGQVVGGDYHEIVKDNPETVSTEWQNYSLVVTPHDIGGQPVLFPQFFLGHLPGTVWIDGVTTSADAMTNSDSTNGTSIVNGIGAAPAPKPALPPGLPNAGEIRLEGTIRETNFADGSFVLLVTRTVQPDGTKQDLPEPRLKTVRLSKFTRLGTGSNRLTNPGLVLQAGDTVAIIGRDLGVGKVIPARQILTQPRP